MSKKKWTHRFLIAQFLLIIVSTSCGSDYDGYSGEDGNDATTIENRTIRSAQRWLLSRRAQAKTLPVDFSLFQCNNNDEKSPCRFFSLRSFLEENNLLVEFEHMKNRNLPALVGNSQIAYVHMHKCGGTSIKAAMFAWNNATSKRTTEEENNKLVVQSYKYSFGGGSRIRKQANAKKRQQYIDTMLLQQHKSRSTRRKKKNDEFATVFSMIRDPVERFLSAVQQVMHYDEEFRTKCLRSTAQATIQCAIQVVSRPPRFRRDVHLLPMVVHLRLLQDIRLVLFDMRRDMARVLEALGASPELHAHDRSIPQYATSNILSSMSVEKDCTDLMKAQICEMYSMDVALVRSLGWPTPHCEDANK